MTVRRRRLSVLHLVDDLKVGGAQRLVVQLSNDRAERGDAVAVSAREGGPLWADLDAAVARLPWRPKGRLTDSALLVGRLRRIARTRGVDIIHVHGRMLALTAAAAVVGLPTVVVEHVHNTFPPTRLARAISFRSRWLVACGSAVENMLVRDFRRPAASVRLIRNGVRDSGRPRPLPPLGEGSKLRVVGIGALNDQKDPGRFIRIMRGLHELGRLDQAIWVGPGDSAGWNAAAERSGVSGAVRFVGPVTDARPHLDAAHVLVMSSRHEGLPLVALEALSAGRGVVLPDVGSCRDVFAGDPGVGVLYPADTDDATLVRRLVDEVDRGGLDRWSHGARQAYESGFTLDTVLAAVDGLYAEVTAP